MNDVEKSYVNLIKKKHEAIQVFNVSITETINFDVKL